MVGTTRSGAHAIGLQPSEQHPPEPVVRDAAQEVHVAAEAGDGAGRVVLAATGRRDDATGLVDDEVDEGLAPDDDARALRMARPLHYQPSARRYSAMARAALPRCDRACFSAALIWPTVRPPGGSDAGSKMGS